MTEGPKIIGPVRIGPANMIAGNSACLGKKIGDYEMKIKPSERYWLVMFRPYSDAQQIQFLIQKCGFKQVTTFDDGFSVLGRARPISKVIEVDGKSHVEFTGFNGFLGKSDQFKLDVKPRSGDARAGVKTHQFDVFLAATEALLWDLGIRELLPKQDKAA